jgi:NitT/TauT family transport system substrate-binding protein
MLRKGTVTCCALAILSVVGVASCTSSTAATTVTPEQSSIVVDSVPVADEAGLYVAQYEGFFKQAGLTVTIKPITGGEAAISDLQSNAAQFVGGNYVSFILAQIAGKFNGKPASFRIVAAGSEVTPGTEVLYAMPRSPYQSVPELARHHASIGLNTTNDIGQVLFGALYAAQGYSFSADATPDIPAQGFPALLKQLLAGQVDAAWLPQPFGTMAEEDGAVQLADLDSGATVDFPFTGYIGSTGWVRSHPRTVTAFVRALTEGQQVADTSRGVAEAAFERYVGVPKVVADAMPFDTYPLGMDIPQLQRVPDDMLEFGLTPHLRKPYQIVAMIDQP